MPDAHPEPTRVLLHGGSAEGGTRHVCKPVLGAVGSDSVACPECRVTYFMATFSMAQTYRGMNDAE